MTAVLANAQTFSDNQRFLIAVVVLMAALFASLAVLAITSSTAIDVMQVSSSLSDSMVVDARQAIFRSGQAAIIE